MEYWSQSSFKWNGNKFTGINKKIIYCYAFIPVFHWVHYTTLNLLVSGFSGGTPIVHQPPEQKTGFKNQIWVGSKQKSREYSIKITRKLQETCSGKLIGFASLAFCFRKASKKEESDHSIDEDVRKLHFLSHMLVSQAQKHCIYLSIYPFFPLDHLISKQWPAIRQKVQSNMA